MSDQVNNFRHGSDKWRRVAFDAVGDVSSKGNSDKCLTISSDMERLRAGIKRIDQGGLEGESLGQHAAVVFMR